MLTNLKTIALAGLVAASASIASISPAIGQVSLKPVPPKGSGWEWVGSYCAGTKPLDSFCPPSQGGRSSQHWVWERILPKRVPSRGVYQMEITYPSYGKRPNPKPRTYTVNCDTWEQYSDGAWTPIEPGSNQDASALLACA